MGGTRVDNQMSGVVSRGPGDEVEVGGTVRDRPRDGEGGPEVRNGSPSSLVTFPACVIGS